MNLMSRLLSTLLVPSALAVTAMGCDQPVTDGPIVPADAPATSFEIKPLPDLTPAVERPHFNELGHFVPSPLLLHAYRATRPPIGADNGFSIRERTPEFFAITAPPSRPIRPMVEWEPMQALVLAFPGEFLTDTNATDTVVEIARHAADYGAVWILVDSRQAQTGLTQRLTNAGFDTERIGTDVHFHQLPFDSIWMIDFSPLPIIDETDGTFAFTDLRYYFDRANDDALPTRLARAMPEAFGVDRAPVTYRAPLTTEGGTFQASTDRVCFTSSRQLYNMSCLDVAANGCDEGILGLDLVTMQTHKYALEMEAVLADYAGCVDLVVTHSVSDDGTGHLDMYFKLLDDERILLGEYRAPFANVFQSENATLMDENAAFLSSYQRPSGGTYTVERLVMPGHRFLQGYGQVPFTYINSTFFNGINLWPAGDYAAWEASRDEAQATWERVLPDMTHQWIDSTNLSFYSGAIHCITRTIPAKAVGAWIADGLCVGGTCNGPTDGYDGACEGTSTGICFGPEWDCECNDCATDCTDPCDGVGYEGCCDGGDVVSCENGALVKYDCGRSGCGWNEWGGYYDCDIAGAEPTGTFPIACGSCEPSCDGRTCGDDGCGGSCGSCSGDNACVNGACREDCFDCEPGAIGCDGTSAWICNAPEAGCKTKLLVDCGASGRICEAGDCIVNPNPEPGPEAAPEVAPEVVAEADDSVNPVKGDDEGCGGGQSPLGWLALAGVALVWRARGRRIQTS